MEEAKNYTPSGERGGEGEGEREIYIHTYFNL
jgi:hypothetical protein